MSVRLLAMEVYRAMRNVEELEKRRGQLPWGSVERSELDGRLAEAKAELAGLKNLMEGAKD